MKPRSHHFFSSNITANAFAVFSFAAFSLAITTAFAQSPSLNTEIQALHKMAGCFLVDYSYAEVESLKEGYQIDPRIYDVNKDKSVKEWIYPIQKSSTELRLQHILFGNSLKGDQIFVIKHHAEDWQHSSSYLYDFSTPGTWTVKDIVPASNMWVRKITALDDGLRYQCAAPWNLKNEYAEWSCDNFSPIPGRETRDMGRRDYNTLERKTRIVVYGNSWLERQNNTKTILQDGHKSALAREEGRNWYVRLPDSECLTAQEWANPRQAYWSLLMQVWEDYYAEKTSWSEVSSVNQMPRFAKLFEIEESNYKNAGISEAIDTEIKNKIRAVVEEYRK